MAMDGMLLLSVRTIENDNFNPNTELSLHINVYNTKMYGGVEASLKFNWME
jgi:hypothetical protein